MATKLAWSAVRTSAYVLAPHRYPLADFWEEAYPGGCPRYTGSAFRFAVDA